MAQVLLIDDDPNIRELVPEALAMEGHEVRCAAHGAAALKLLESFTPDLILLDMRMPVMDGWQFAAAYRIRPGPRAPVFVFSAARNANEWAAQIGADGVLGKPFDLEDLYHMVGQQAVGIGPTKGATR